MRRKIFHARIFIDGDCLCMFEEFFVFFFINFFPAYNFFCSVILYVHTYSFLTHYSGSTIFCLYDLCFLMTTLQKREIASLLAFILCWCMKNDGNLWFLSGSAHSLACTCIRMRMYIFLYYISIFNDGDALDYTFSSWIEMWENCHFVLDYGAICTILS